MFCCWLYPNLLVPNNPLAHHQTVLALNMHCPVDQISNKVRLPLVKMAKSMRLQPARTSPTLKRQTLQCYLRIRECLQATLEMLKRLLRTIKNQKCPGCAVLRRQLCCPNRRESQFWFTSDQRIVTTVISCKRTLGRIQPPKPKS